MNKQLFYIYRHIRLDTNTPFYIGKGIRSRAKSKYSRNLYWHSIVNSVGYRVEILFKNLNNEEAISKEIQLIKLYRKFGFCEANFTDGGDGSVGFIHSQESKDKLREFHKGNTYRVGKKHTEESIERMRIAHLGMRQSEESKLKLSSSIKGRKKSEEHKAKIAATHLGKVGKKHTEECKKRISYSQKIRLAKLKE